MPEESSHLMMNPGSHCNTTTTLATTYLFQRRKPFVHIEIMNHGLCGVTGFAGSESLLQPIMPLDLPVKVRSWGLTVYPRSHIRH